MRPLARVASQAALLFGALAVALLGAEIVVRLFGRVPIVPSMYVDDMRTAFRPRPNARERAVWRGVFDWTWTTNSEGFRGQDEYARPKPTAVRRVMVLGDSFTFGFGVNDTTAYPDRLERLLAGVCVDERVEVINAGISASGTSQQLALLEHYGLRYEPDAIILGFFMNDLEDNLDKGVHELEDGLLRESPPGTRPAAYARTGPAKRIVNAIPGYEWLTRRSAFVNWLRQMFFRAQAVGAPAALPRWGQGPAADVSAPEDPILADRKWTLMEALLARLAGVAREHHSSLIVLLLPSQEIVESYVAGDRESVTTFVRMQELCARLGLRCVDVAEHVARTMPSIAPATLYIPYEGHFAGAGHLAAATAVAPATAEALGCRTDRASPTALREETTSARAPGAS